MKILYVSTISNTVNAFLIPHIKILIDEGHQVDVAFKIEQEVKKEVVDLGCKVIELPFSRNPLENNFKSLIGKVRDLVIKEEYNVVHTHTPIASAVVRLACKNMDNVKVIYTAHGFHFYDGAPIKNWLFYYPVEKYLSKFTDVLITINNEDFERAKTFNAKQVEYVPGVGIDLDNLEVDLNKRFNLKEDLKINDDDFVLLSIGELNSNKNHKIVIEALNTLKNDKVKYFICGTGALQQELEDLIKEYKLEKQVELLGYRSDIEELLSVSDIFMFPSFREGLSKALMEAMAMGKPVIASDIRGNSDLIENQKGGCLFNPTNVDEITICIQKMISDDEFREKTSKHNIETIKQFSLGNILSKLEKIYSVNVL